MKPKVIRIAAVLSSITLISAYVGCRASQPDQQKTNSPAAMPGSKSEVIPLNTPEHFGGSKSAAVFERPPAPKAADKDEPPSQQVDPK